MTISLFQQVRDGERGRDLGERGRGGGPSGGRGGGSGASDTHSPGGRS